MSIQYLKSNTLTSTTVLVRGSLDVPLDEQDGSVADDFRLKALVPTLQLLLDANCTVVLCGKLGRPEGKVVEALSLLPVAKHLAKLMNLHFVSGKTAEKTVESSLYFFAGDIREEVAQKKVQSLSGRGIVCLENLEFYAGELENDVFFAKKLATLGEAYVNDDFSKCHHVCASIDQLPGCMPAHFSGLELEREIKALTSVLTRKDHPFVVMTGGMKLSEKAGVLENLGKRADKILVGGGVANLFFLSKGMEVGISRIEEAEKKIAWQLEKNFKDKIVLPEDVVVADKDMSKHSIRVTSPHHVQKNEQILDAGPKTILAFAREIKLAKTIVWSGPLGHFEVKPFDTATMALARLIGGRGRGHAYAVVGGGETVDAVRHAHQAEHIDHLSTGGGAMLEFLAGKKLPGIEALQ